MHATLVTLQLVLSCEHRAVADVAPVRTLLLVFAADVSVQDEKTSEPVVAPCAGMRTASDGLRGWCIK